MSDMRRTGIGAFLGVPLFSPAGFVLRAGLLAAAFGICHAFGLRSYTTVLSGTAPPGAAGVTYALLGTAYVLCYLGATVAAPILVISAAVLAAFQRALPGRAGSPDDEGDVDGNAADVG